VSDKRERLAESVRPEIRGLQPYEAEASGPGIRLDANESPFDVPEAFKAGILERLRKLPWNRYPDPQAADLRRLLGRWERVPPEQILLGNGSDEIIRDLLTAYGGPGTRTVFPTPTFSMYRQLTIATGGTPVGIPLGENWELDGSSVLEALAAPASRMLFLASPNNPTGQVYPAEQIEELVSRTDRLVVVDEAYRLFAGTSFASRLADHPNLAILNTFSKSMSLAGVRVGYLVAHPEVVDVLNRIRLPYNVDALAQAVAAEICRQPEWWQAQAQRVIAERERLGRALARLPGVRVYPSQANFLLLRVPRADRLRQALAAGDVAVRGFPGAERLGDCLRVTVGRPEDNDRLLSLMAASLENEGER